MIRNTRKVIVTLIAVVVLVVTYLFIPAINTFVNNAFTVLTKADVVALKEYLLAFGVWAPVISALLMVFQSVIAPLPAFVITFTNGLLFGVFWGTVLSWSSAMVGAAVCFYIARTFGRPAVVKLTGGPSLEMTDRFFEKYGKHAIIVARLLPIMPFDPVSYGAGLTSMTFGGFMLATGIGQLPATVLYSYLGQTATGTVRVVFVVFSIVFALLVMGTALQKWMQRRMLKSEASVEG